MKVILISGHAQNGKDTTAKFIKSRLEKDGKKVIVAHYGDLVKYVCKTFFDWDGLKDHRGRSLLQYVGTDVVRAKKPTFWVDFIINMLELFGSNWDYALIPDTRFPNEISTISNHFDTLHLRVLRSNFESPLTAEQQAHPSEVALDCVTPDAWIHNDGDIHELKEKVNQFVTEELYGN